VQSSRTRGARKSIAARFMVRRISIGRQKLTEKKRRLQAAKRGTIV
jgi:hypothetical protein